MSTCKSNRSIHAATIDRDRDRDHGTSVELKDGLQDGERIVRGPPATPADDTKVKEHRTEDDKKADQKSPG